MGIRESLEASVARRVSRRAGAGAIRPGGEAAMSDKLEAGPGAPKRLACGPREAFVVVMPSAWCDVVDGTPRELVDLVRLRPEFAADDRAQVQDRDGAVRMLAGSSLAKEHAR